MSSFDKNGSQPFKRHPSPLAQTDLSQSDSEVETDLSQSDNEVETDRPQSSSTYVIVDDDLLKEARNDKERLKSVHGAVTTYRITAAERMNQFRRQSTCKNKNFKMILVRTWTPDDDLPDRNFNIGMASALDGFLIHEHKSLFNENFCTKPEFGGKAAFFDDYARSLIDDEKKKEILRLLKEALKKNDDEHGNEPE